MYVFSAELWQYDGPSAWYFLSLPPDIADDIRAAFGAQAAGFGSIKVEAAVRSTQWTTSLFPDKARGTYLLPVKKSVRAAENLEAGDMATVRPPDLTAMSVRFDGCAARRTLFGPPNRPFDVCDATRTFGFPTVPRTF